ncbi:MAG TPA: hypothetical protein VKN99_08655 [Polyangia bacterium]|nr:hypothetical protein [Polyangia bacterium]
MMPWQALATLAFLLAAPERSVVSDRYQVRIDAPAGWTVLRQTAYPSMIAVMTHKDGGRLTLSAQRARAGDTVEAVAERNRAALERTGMQTGKVGPSSIGEGTVELTATTRDGKLQVRQLHFLHGSTEFALTLTAPPPKMAAYAKDLDAAWRAITYLPPKSAKE